MKNGVKETPLYNLVRKIVESEIGAPKRKSKMKQNEWVRIPYVKEPETRLFIEFSPLEAKPVELEGIKISMSGRKIEKAKREKARTRRNIKNLLMRFKQKGTQYPHFNLGLKIGLLISHYYGLKDVHAGTEVSLYIPSPEGELQEIGQRDLFIHGLDSNHKRRGVSLEIESELNRSSIRKLLYALHDTVHLEHRGEMKPVSLLHHIILTKYISGFAYNIFNLKRFDDPYDLTGAFDVSEIYKGISENPTKLSDVVSTIISHHEQDATGLALHIKNPDRVIGKLEELEKSVASGKKLTRSDKLFLADILGKLREYNVWKNSISFHVTEDLVRTLSRDKGFMRNVVRYIGVHSFPKSLKARVLDTWEKKGRIDKTLMKDVLDYLAKHARKTLQRTTIIYVPEDVLPGGNRKLLLDKIKIIRFRRLGKEYRLVPEILTLNDYLDKVRNEEWKIHAEYIEKQIEEGKPVNIAFPTENVLERESRARNYNYRKTRRRKPRA